MLSLVAVVCLQASLLDSASARLLSPDDVPAVTLAAPGAGPPGEPFSLPVHLAFGMGAGVLSAFTGQYLMLAVSSVTINTYAQLVVWGLVAGFAAPAFTTLVAVLVGNVRLTAEDGLFPFVVPWLLTSAVHIAAVAVGILAGVTVANTAALALLSLVDGLAMGATSVLSMRALRPTLRPAQELKGHVPVAGPTHFIALSSMDW